MPGVIQQHVNEEIVAGAADPEELLHLHDGWMDVHGIGIGAHHEAGAVVGQNVA